MYNRTEGTVNGKHEFKYLGPILCKYGSMEEETKVRSAWKESCGIIGAYKRMDSEYEKKKVPTVAYANETWT